MEPIIRYGRQSGRSTRQLRDALNFALENNTRVVYVIHSYSTKGYYKHLVAETLKRPDLLHLIEFKSLADLQRDENAMIDKRLRGWVRGSLFIDHFAHEMWITGNRPLY